ncbi:MAG: hypothetical protein RR092_02475, partial [Oscillospiraceae bacterium]
RDFTWILQKNGDGFHVETHILRLSQKKKCSELKEKESHEENTERSFSFRPEPVPVGGLW